MTAPHRPSLPHAPGAAARAARLGAGRAELFDLLDYAWRRFAADSPDPTAAQLRRPVSSRDGATTSSKSFFNWPQLYLLGGATTCLTPARSTGAASSASSPSSACSRDEFELGYDWFHLGESLLFLYWLSMAAPVRWRDRAVRFADLYVDPGTVTMTPRSGSSAPAQRVRRRPGAPGCPTRPTTPGCRTRPELRLPAGLAPPGRCPGAPAGLRPPARAGDAGTARARRRGGQSGHRGPRRQRIPGQRGARTPAGSRPTSEPGRSGPPSTAASSPTM